MNGVLLKTSDDESPAGEMMAAEEECSPAADESMAAGEELKDMVAPEGYQLQPKKRDSISLGTFGSPLKKYEGKLLKSSMPLSSLRGETSFGSKRVVHMLWTGGFDSTTLLLRHLKDGEHVQPIYMRHSPSSEKSEIELETRKRIRKHLGNPGSIHPDVIWDYEQLASTPSGKLLSDTMHELADAALISHQYSALRFCRDVTQFTGQPDIVRNIELGVVAHDELWERLTIADRNNSPVWNFFKGFSFPLINESKRELWTRSTPIFRDVLKMTYCCESPSGGKSCIERGCEFEHRCCPCKRRFEGLLD